MIHKNRNLSNTALNQYLAEVTVSNGDTFINCNLSRFKQENLFVGITGLTFQNCNLVNCLLPEDAAIEDCLHIQKSFCTHLLDEKDVVHSLTPCIENCVHVVDSDTVFIDEQDVLGTVYYRRHKLSSSSSSSSLSFSSSSRSSSSSSWSSSSSSSSSSSLLLINPKVSSSSSSSSNL